MENTISIDGLTIQGKWGKPNQDYFYILHDCYKTKKNLFGIISDGCSSVENTEIDSMMLTIMVKEIILETYLSKKKIPPFQYLFNCLKKKEKINSLIFPGQSLFFNSTLGIISSDKFGIHIQLLGDGVILFLYEDKEKERLILEKKEIKFYNNAPLYFSIRFSNDIFKAYKEAGIRQYIEEGIYDGEKYITKQKEHQSPEMQDFFFPYVENDRYILKHVILSTDGLFSFSNIEEEKEIIKYFYSFTNLKGKFLNRRVRKMVKDFLKSNKNIHDDLTMVGISIT